jgi:nucleoid DNA-binding protein
MAAKKAAAKAAPKKPKPKPIADKQTKAQIITSIAETTGLPKKDVVGVFAALGQLIGGHVQKKGSGEFVIPDTGVKIRRVQRPARKARMGRNPATGEAMKIAAKPASTVVRVTALKVLKEQV